jgi:hypothetical protein
MGRITLENLSVTGQVSIITAAEQTSWLKAD